MAAPKDEKPGVLDEHRLEMVRRMEEIDKRAGVTGKAEVTAEQLQARMIANGVRPEDNIASSELIRERYGGDLEKEATTMAIPIEDAPVRFITGEARQELVRLAREVNARAGIPAEPTMTLEELHQSQLARGIRPEDNIASREIMRMRYGDDWDKE